MPLLKRIRVVSLIIFWPALGFGVFGLMAGDRGAGALLLSLAAAAGLWFVICAVADRVIEHLASMDQTMIALASALSRAETDARKVR